MSLGEWAALIAAIAGGVAGLAALPANTANRDQKLLRVMCAVLLISAFILGLKHFD